MNNCPHEERLAAFLDGELPELEAFAIQTHVATCPACSRELTALRELDILAATAPAPRVAPAAWDATWAAISARVAAGHHRARPVVWRRVVAFAAAAAACLTLAAGALALRGRPAAGPPDQARECVLEDLEAAAGYSASVSFSPDAQVILITVAPTPSEEAPANAPTGGTL